MDGTIVNNISFHNLARIKFLEKYHVHLEAAELNSISTKELVKRFIDPNISSEKLKELDQEKQSIYRDLYKDHVSEVNGFKQLLLLAKSLGWKVGLATMGGYPNIDMVIDHLQVREYFDAIVSGDDVAKGKPNPEIYLKTLELLNIEASEAIVFEDTQSGLMAAKLAGIDAVGICTSHTAAQFSEWGAKQSILNFEEVSVSKDPAQVVFRLPCKLLTGVPVPGICC